MSLWLTLALATLASVTPMQTAANARSASEVERLQIQLAVARTRFQRALAAHHFRRDDPVVVATGRDLTRELIPLLAPRAEGRGDVVGTLALIASDALGPYLATLDRGAEPTLALTYIRAHDDPAFLARLVGDPVDLGGALTPGGEALLEVAHRGRLSVVPALSSLFPRLRGTDRERVCHAAAHLPRAGSESVVSALVAALPATAPPETDAGCVVLAMRSVAGRALIARWIESSELSAPFVMLPRWYLAAAFGLADSEQRAAARRAQAAVIASGIVSDATDVLQRLAPMLTLESPRARDLAWNVAMHFPYTLRILGPARLRARDTAIVGESLTVLTNPRHETSALRTALLVVGLGAPEATLTTTRARLVSFREFMRALPTRFDAREVDAWLDAMTAVTACRGAHACLADLVARGSEAAAARALFALGPRGLASLDEVTSDALVRRLSTAATTPLLGAFALTVRGCPARLRGALEARTVADDQLIPIRPFYSAFVAACGEPSGP